MSGRHVTSRGKISPQTANFVARPSDRVKRSRLRARFATGSSRRGSTRMSGVRTKADDRLAYLFPYATRRSVEAIEWR